MRLKWTFWDILGYLGTFWDISEDCMSLEHLDCFPCHIRQFVTHNRLIKNKSVQTTMRLKWTFCDILGQFGTIQKIVEEFGAFGLLF